MATHPSVSAEADPRERMPPTQGFCYVLRSLREVAGIRSCNTLTVLSVSHIHRGAESRGKETASYLALSFHTLASRAESRLTRESKDGVDPSLPPPQRAWEGRCGNGSQADRGGLISVSSMEPANASPFFNLPWRVALPGMQRPP